MVKCPNCNKEFKTKPIKKWRFRSYDVERYECKLCGQKFNLYIGEKLQYTIPKAKRK